MGEIMKQVSNLPLTCPGTPGTVTEIQGCKFTPAVYLNRGHYYLIIVTHRGIINPQSGFYDVPEKSMLTYIGSFKPIACSFPNSARIRCFIFEAFEASPPKDFVPTPGYIEGAGLMRTGQV
jgi:hypothetical protein